MKTAIHNTIDNTTTIRDIPKWQPLPEHYILLQVIRNDRPAYNPATHRLESSWQIDLTAKTYTQIWTETPLSAYEIAMQDWLYPDRALKIKAPKHYARTMPEMVTWFQINKFEIDTDTDPYFVYVYVDAILEEDEPLLGLPEITVFERPEK